MAKVDVLIPVYNTEKYLKRLLTSLENQTFKDFSVIIVNDGSTDNSLKILERFADQSKLSIKIISQENRGAAGARQAAFNLSTAPYIVFIDSDDCIENNYLEVLLNTLEDTKTNICSSRITYHPNNIPIIGINNKLFSRNPYDLLEDKQTLAVMQCGTVGKIFKREYLLLPDETFNGNEDVSINYLNYANARYVSFTRDTHYLYYPNNFGLSATKTCGYTYEKMIKTFLPLAKLKENFKKHNLDEVYYSELEAIFIRFIFQRITEIFIGVKDKNIALEMVNCILSFLELHYPNWRNNKYYKSNYIGFEIPEATYCLVSNLYLHSHKIETDSLTEEEILKRYRSISSKLDK